LYFVGVTKLLSVAFSCAASSALLTVLSVPSSKEISSRLVKELNANRVVEVWRGVVKPRHGYIYVINMYLR
jgi:hypothetical protein